MIKPLFIQVALPLKISQLFDYLVPPHVEIRNLIPGIRVKVPFGSRQLIGILVRVCKFSSVAFDKLKTAEVLDQTPYFSSDVFNLCEWAHHYYHYPLGEILASALPTLLRKGKAPMDSPTEALFSCTRAKDTGFKQNTDNPHSLTLNLAQHEAIRSILKALNVFQVFLLDGVTGSGKTEVYLQVIQEVITRNKQVLVLIPEISLTTQTIDRFTARFSIPIAIIHSALSEKERWQTWQKARSGEAKIVIGTRSAIFIPFAQLGLIVIDEEQDASFKQQDRFRYHARDLAIVRSRYLNIPILLGSATPSLESLLNAKHKRYCYLTLLERAGEARLPTYRLIDLRLHKVKEGLSLPLLTAMKAELSANNQVMLFLNRRGYAPVLYCISCAWVASCRSCDARMVVHKAKQALHCHHCDAKRNLPLLCEQCGEKALKPIGMGTERLEKTLKDHFPDVPLFRIDRDTTKSQNFDHLFDQIHKASAAILIGTQMLAKGHHFPNVTLVALINADSGLFSIDFRAMEYMGQLLVQVAGRAGREKKEGSVFIQTHYPYHPDLQLLIHQGYPAFSQKLLQERESMQLPPFHYIALFRAEAKSNVQAIHFLARVKKLLFPFTHHVHLLGPTPALISKKKGKYVHHLLLKAKNRKLLQQTLQTVLGKIEKLSSHSSVRWVIEIDPIHVI